MSLRIERNPEVTDALLAEVADLWARVTNAGGAVGLPAPVSPEEVLPLARTELGRVGAGLDDLVVALEDERLVAFGLLVTSAGPVSRHVGTIKRLQRDPRLVGQGVGAAVLSELEDAAWGRGLAVIALTVRGGSGRERFYEAHGYRFDATLPDRLRVDGELIGEHHLSKRHPGVSATPSASEPVLAVRRLSLEATVPAYAHSGDAGLDLAGIERVELAPGERAVVRTGLAVAIPEGHVGLVHPRSGLAARHGLALVNAPGTIDAGYRGEVKVIVVNLDSEETVTLEAGERIAQLVVQQVTTVRPIEVEALPDAERGEDGFGSTGR